MIATLRRYAKEVHARIVPQMLTVLLLINLRKECFAIPLVNVFNASPTLTAHQKRRVNQTIHIFVVQTMDVLQIVSAQLLGLIVLTKASVEGPENPAMHAIWIETVIFLIVTHF